MTIRLAPDLMEEIKRVEPPRSSSMRIYFMLVERSSSLPGVRSVVIYVIYMRNTKVVKMELVCWLRLDVLGGN